MKLTSHILLILVILSLNLAFADNEVLAQNEQVQNDVKIEQQNQFEIDKTLQGLQNISAQNSSVGYH